MIICVCVRGCVYMFGFVHVSDYVLMLAYVSVYLCLRNCGVFDVCLCLCLGLCMCLCM